ncbi:hypothetical protein Aperf_G00000107186 [Anoplocephala perfoliata]
MNNSTCDVNVIAVYRYAKTSSEDLQFEKGERLTILRKLTDGNWALARNNRGQTGLIPLNFVENEAPPLWLHGKITRDETEKLLENEPIGSFLVRESGRFAGDYTLSVVAPDPFGINRNGKAETPVQHYHIYSVDGLDGSDSSRFFSLDNKDVFPSLRKLVEHYKVGDRGLAHPLTEPVVDTERVCLQRLRDHHWVSRERLVFGQNIGRGEFGEVLKASYGDLEVAVKRYKATARRQLIYEACVMSQLKHENLLALLGITEDKGGGEADVGSTVEKTTTTTSRTCPTLCLVTEFSPLGSLLAFLRSRGRVVIPPTALLSFATDVARGLAYMESRSFLHCDVAARNVLLFTPTTSSHSPHPVAKLGDFGLAFRLRPPAATNGNRNHDYEDLDVDNSDDTCFFAFNGSQRMANNITQIPIKWTAPESIRTRDCHQIPLSGYPNLRNLHRLKKVLFDSTVMENVILSVFTHKSDVWSFGVMLWELYSYGRLPYPRLMTNQVLAHLESGERMESPQDCPRCIYSLMLDTWSTEPMRRPSFEEILLRLQRPSNEENDENWAFSSTPMVSAAGDSGSSAYDSIFDDKII